MTIAVNINIGSSIRRVLAENKISQAELGRRLGKSPIYITRLLGRLSTDTTTINRVCEALDYNFFKEFTPNLKREESEKFYLTYPHIGCVILSVLKEKKVTQKELGNFLGISQDVVCRILKNNSMNTSRLVKISNYLDYDFFGCFYGELVLKEKRTDLVMLTEVEQKVARVLWSGIETRCLWTPEGRDLVRKSIDKLKVIFKEHKIMED